MASRTQPASDLVYEDFQPLYEWVKDERLVNVMLPGKFLLYAFNIYIHFSILLLLYNILCFLLSNNQ